MAPELLEVLGWASGVLLVLGLAGALAHAGAWALGRTPAPRSWGRG